MDFNFTYSFFNIKNLNFFVLLLFQVFHLINFIFFNNIGNINLILIFSKIMLK